jgi:riboflavin biosynthesis pyrimidine reductase
MEFPIPEDLIQEGRKVLVFTTQRADQTRVKNLRELMDDVIVVGDEVVDGVKLWETLVDLGYRVVYSAAGPKVHHLLLAAGVVDRLYLSLANIIIGGKNYSSIVEGPLLPPGMGFRLNSLYYDTAVINGSGQLLLSYDITSPTRS